MQRVPIPSVRQDERIGSSFNHIIQVVDLTERASSDTPDRNAVTLSIAVGSQNLRIGRKGKRETTLKGSPNTANGAPLQGAYITPYMVSVGAPAAYPRLLRGDGFTVLPRMTTTTTVLPRMTTITTVLPRMTTTTTVLPRMTTITTVLPRMTTTTTVLPRMTTTTTVLPRMTKTTTVLPQMATTTTTQRSQRDTLRATHAQPDRNAVTLSIAVGSQNLRIGRKGKWETTLKGSPNTANGAPLQGANITPYMVSVGAPAAYPRLLRGDGFTVLPRTTAFLPRMTTTTTVLPRRAAGGR